MPARSRIGARAVLFWAGVSALLIVTGLWLKRAQHDVAAGGLAPEPIAPFGPVSRGDLEFRWAVPKDRAAVCVEILAANASGAAIWRSDPVETSLLRPAPDIAGRWPLDDLLWRPVAVPKDGPERPGDLAAFSLVP